MKVVTIDSKHELDSQKISIPQDMRIDDDKLYIKRLGNAIYLIPFHNPWQNLIESVDLFTTDFMEDRIQIDYQKRASFD